MKIAIGKLEISKIFVSGTPFPETKILPKKVYKTIHVLIKVSSLVCQHEGKELSVKLFFIITGIMKPM